MNGDTEHKQINDPTYNNYHNTWCTCPDCRFKSCDRNTQDFIKRFPEDFRKLVRLLVDNRLSNHSNTFDSIDERSDAVREHPLGSSFARYCREVVAYYVDNGRYSCNEYIDVFHWQYNKLYMRSDLDRFKCLVLVNVVDEMIDSGYKSHIIRDLINKLYSFDIQLCLHCQNILPVGNYECVSNANGEYFEFINMLDDVTRVCGDAIFDDSVTLYSLINYRFANMLVSYGIQPFDFNSSYIDVLRNNIPFSEAMRVMFSAIAQGSVTDLGYMDLISRSIKSSIDVPHQVHRTFKAVSSSAESMSFCVDRMNSISDSLTTFITNFMSRVDTVSAGLSKDVVIDVIEIVIDFLSDIGNFAAVSRMRWITYTSRILRIFIPNSISLALNLFNTYFATLFTAVAQGVDDMIQTIVVVLTGAIALQAVPDKPNVNKMMEYMKAINLSVPFSKNIVVMLTSIFNMLPEMIKAWANNFVPEHVFYQRLIEKYGTIIDRIDTFLTYDLDTVYFNRDLTREFNNLYVSAHDLVKDMAPFIRDNSGEFSLLREQLRKFDKMFDSFQAIQKCGVIRECPFSLTIFGSSQIGKSTLSSAIAKFMFPNVPSDRVRYVIPTDPDEFWSGYSPMHCVTAEDDADQDAEYKNALQLFSIVTNAPYQPPMASVDDHSIGVKGTPYHSKMHIRCTNNAYPTPSVKVLTVEAYWKRRHMLVCAEVKKDYIIDGKVQYCPAFKHLTFSLLNPIDPNATKVPIGDLPDFLLELRRRYDAHMANEKVIMDMMNATGEDFMSQLSDAYNRGDLLPDAQGRLTDMFNESWNNARISVNGTFAKIKQYLENTPMISKMLKLFAVVAGISATTVAMITMYNTLFRQDVSAEAIPSGDVRTNKYKRIKRPAYAEGTCDPTADSLVVDVVRGRQVYAALYDRRTGKVNNMCGLFIGGRYVVFPNHLFVASDGKCVEEHSRFVLTTDQAVFEQMFESGRVTRLKTKDGRDKDVSVYECTLQVRAFRDIRHHFISENDLTYIPNWAEAALNKFNMGEHERQLVNITNVTNQMYNVNMNMSPYTLYRGFQYDAITVSGDCGSILVIYNTRIVGKILGIHVAGERNRHHGYSDLITKEMLDEFNPRVQPRTKPNIVDDKPAVILPEGNYTYYGTVAAKDAVYPVTRTEIKKSVIHGEIMKPITAPVSLSRDDFGETISRFFNPSMPINPKIKEVLLRDAYECNDALNSFKLGVISEYEAINGNSKYPYFERLNMSTSPGLPYKKICGGKGKKAFFSEDDCGNYVVNHPTLRTLIDNRIAMAKDGQAADSMWMDIPKDERRKPGKKTRMIVTPPLDYQIVFRMYFMDYIIAYYNSKLKLHSAVGINPYSMDWTELMNELKSYSDVGGDGDHTGFDGAMLTDFLEIDIMAINHYYRYEPNHDVNSRIREVLWYEIVHTPTQCVNVAYCVHCGVPSGCNCTTIINTNGNDKYYKLAWLGLAPVEKRSMKHYYDNVRVFCYGDDSIAAIRREVLSWYNLKLISEHLAMYGIKFTMADKTGTMLEYKNLEECTFLKNGFRKDGMIYHATMDEGTLYEMVNWIRDSDDDYGATIVNANMSLMMWYHYGVDRFNVERDKLVTALLKAGERRDLVPHLLTYDYLDDCFRTDRVPIAEGLDSDESIYSHYKTEVPMETLQDVAGEPVNNSLFSRLFRRELPQAQGNETQPGTSTTAGEENAINAKEETTVANAVTFIEEKPSVNIDKSVPLNTNVETMFGQWSLQRFFGKPQRVGTYQFTTTQTQGDMLKEVVLPDVFWKIDQWANIVNSFTFMRYRPVLRVQLNGNKFCAGRLLLYGVPFSHSIDGAIYKPANKNMSGYTAFEHAFLDASSNDVATLTMPWVYPREWVSLATNALSSRASINNLYVHNTGAQTIYYNVARTHSYRLCVFNPLQVGTGAPTAINATIFIHLEEVDICVPAVYKTTAQGGSTSYVTQNINNWEKVASQTLPTQIVGDKYDFKSDLKVSTMDKPNFTLSPDYFVKRAVGYMSHAVNFEHLERLTLYPNGVSTCKESDFGTNVDEMSLSYLTSKYTYYLSGTISTVLTSGQTLTYFPITPYILPSNVNQPSPRLVGTNPGGWSAPGTTFQIPLLSYVSMPFNFWGGSLKYRFEFITNAFATAKVYAAIIYGTLAPENPTTGIEPTSAMGYTFEINGDNKTFEIDVPYVADTPWKRVLRSQISTSATIINGAYEDNIPDECCIGQVALYIINPLSVPAGLPTSYAFNVFIAGGPDFRLNYVSRANTAWVPLAQGNDGVSIDPNPGTDLSMLGQALYRTDLGVMSEIYTSIKDVLKRYCHVNTSFNKIEGAGTDEALMYSVPVVIPISSLITPFTSSNASNIKYASNVFNWYMALYRAWRGSLRFKIVFEIENEQETRFVVPHISVDYFPDNMNLISADRLNAMGANNESSGGTSTLGPSSTTYYNTTHHGPRSLGNDTAPFVEVEVPFVYPNRIAPVPLVEIDGTSNLDRSLPPGTRSLTYVNQANNFGSLVINYPRTLTGYICTTRVFIAAGDDFRAGCQIGTPMIFYGGIKGAVVGTNYGVPPDFYN
jgi:hypothetical protein